MNDTAVVFVGPSLDVEEARAAFDATYLPPVAQGDVYRVARHRPPAIGIIDGYFDRVPAVWHKEVLWAMAQGIYVFGAASMGALRAAELAPFGMIGVGRIFEWYRDGDIEDDDEVAVAHGSSDTNYVGLSEPMVNVRATMAEAEAAGVVARDTASSLVDLMKRWHYPDRSYAELLARGVDVGVSAHELDALRTWLAAGRVNLKRRDAITMLAVMRSFLDRSPPPFSAPFRFEYTESWDQLQRESGDGDSSSGGAVIHDALLDEVRLDGKWSDICAAAALRVLARREADRLGASVDEESLQTAVLAFRRERMLWEPEDLNEWLKCNDLDAHRFLRLIEDEVLLRRVVEAIGPEVRTAATDELRLAGDYADRAGAAAAKEGLVDIVDLDNAVDLHETAWSFYAQRRFLDEQVDITEHAASLGFADIASFRQALLADYLYRERGGSWTRRKETQ